MRPDYTFTVENIKEADDKDFSARNKSNKNNIVNIPKQKGHTKNAKTERNVTRLHKNEHIFENSPNKESSKPRIKTTKLSGVSQSEMNEESDVERKTSVISRFSHIFGDAVTDCQRKNTSVLNRSVDRKKREDIVLN